MKTLKSTQSLRVVLGLFLAFAVSGKMWAQSSNSRFVAEGAVHEYLEEDRVQARANAFIYEGKFEEYRKWHLHIKKESRKMEEAFKKKMKKIKDEDVRDSLYEEYKRQRYNFVYQPCPYPQHEYVVIIRPTLKPTRGFAVEKDKVVYMDYNKLESGPLNISATEISEDVCMALRSLMDNIVESAKLTYDGPKVLDGTTYSIIDGHFPCYMVKSHGGSRNNEEGAACRLLEKLSEAAKQKDAATINAQLEEIKRLDAFYSALKVK